MRLFLMKQMIFITLLAFAFVITNLPVTSSFSGIGFHLRQTPARDAEDEAAPLPLRSYPQTLDSQQMQTMISANGFYESILNPTADVPNQYYRIFTQSDVVVIDVRYELMWAIGFRLYASADTVSEVLPGIDYAGYDDWRLPSLEELASLLRPLGKNGYYYANAFSEMSLSETISCDKSSEQMPPYAWGVWGVSFKTGRVIAVTPTLYIPILPVRSMKKMPTDGVTGATIRGLKRDW